MPSPPPAPGRKPRSPNCSPASRAAERLASPASVHRPRSVAGSGGGAVGRHGVVGLVVRARVVGELELHEPDLAPLLAEIAVVGVEEPELADVGDELGEEA